MRNRGRLNTAKNPGCFVVIFERSSSSLKCELPTKRILFTNGCLDRSLKSESCAEAVRGVSSSKSAIANAEHHRLECQRRVLSARASLVSVSKNAMKLLQHATIRRFPGSLGRTLCVLALVFVSSYCTEPEQQTKISDLTSDELYLVGTYVQVVQAHELHSVSYLESESLFAAVDSTIDSTRIANTIQQLDETPDRWLLIFRKVEQDLKNAPIVR